MIFCFPVPPPSVFPRVVSAVSIWHTFHSAQDKLLAQPASAWASRGRSAGLDKEESILLSLFATPVGLEMHKWEAPSH